MLASLAVALHCAALVSCVDGAGQLEGCGQEDEGNEFQS